MGKKDLNQTAKFIARIATGEIQKPNPNEGKNPAAVELGRLGGLKGGKARSKKLTAEQRKKIATNAANQRWGSKEGTKP
jgi:hypothetical protein